MADEIVRLTQARDYQFDVDFGTGGAPLRADLPAPLGEGAGPSPEHFLAAAVGNCLCSSLLFALRKFKQAPDPIRADVATEVGRNDAGKLRVLAIRATLTLGVPAAALQHLDRVLPSFEAYCTVTQSVAQGIRVDVRVQDADGTVLKG